MMIHLATYVCRIYFTYDQQQWTWFCAVFEAKRMPNKLHEYYVHTRLLFVTGFATRSYSYGTSVQHILQI